MAFYAEAAAQGVMQPGLHVAGQFDRFRIAEKLHGHPGLIDHDFALFTVFEMALEFLPHRQIEIAVDIIGNLANDVFAVQFATPWRK